MDEEIALFIGGPCDGQRRKVYVGQQRVEAVNLPTMSMLDLRLPRDPNPPREAMKYDGAIYERSPVRSQQGTDTAVYVYGDIDPMAAMIAYYREPGNTGKREQIVDLGKRDHHVRDILMAQRAGMLNSYKDALEEMVIVLAEKAAMYERQLMRLHGMTIPQRVITDAGVAMIFKPQKPDPL